MITRQNIIDIMAGEYWDFEFGYSSVRLDGSFTIEQLELLCQYMKERVKL